LISPAPACSQQSDRLISETPQRELQHRCRGAVEPLQVVDGNEHGRGVGKCAQSAENADADGSPIGRPACGLAQDKGDFERHPLRAGKSVLDLAELLREEVAERDEREARLGLHRARRDNAEPRLGSRRDPCA
jgi:hypothetical protein